MIIGDLRQENFSSIWLGEKRKLVYEQIDLTKCGPCRYAWYNEIIDYFAESQALNSLESHKNFI